MSDLATLVPSLERAVAVPGTFDTVFPDTLDTDLVGVLMDAFAEAQFDGWLPGSTVNDVGTVTPDLTRAEGAMVVLYASIRMLMVEIRNRKTHTRYESSGSVFEQDQSASLLNQLLREMQARKVQLTQWARQGRSGDAFAMADLYLAKSFGYQGMVSWPYLPDAVR